jgi:DNA-binding NtrC family response regulator/predicted negative regulator of RcsB-dependent stress response
MTPSTQIPVPIAEWSREALEIEAGARLLLIGDDPLGQGRAVFRSLYRRMKARGLRVHTVGLASTQARGGKVHAGDLFERAHMALFAERQRERLVDTLRERLTNADSTLREPFVLFVEDIEHADDQTKLLVEMLLDTGVADYPFGDAPCMRAMVVALDRHGPTAETLARHPGTMRFAPGPAPLGEGRSPRRLRVELIRAIRYLQLADRPLRIAELEYLTARGMHDRLGREGVELVRSGRSTGATLELAEPFPAGLPDPASLPEAELRRYHERLLGVFEARRSDPPTVVARLRHAVGSMSADHVIRRAADALDVLIGAHRIEEARELLVASLDVLAGDRAHQREVIHLRRRLARLEAVAGRPLDAAACVKSIPRSRRSTEDELLLARSLLGAGRPQEAHEALVDSLGRRPAGTSSATAGLTAVLAEVEYIRGNLDGANRLCRDLLADESLTTDDRALVNNTHGKVYLARGDYEEAGRIFKANLEQAHDRRLERHEIVARINAGVARMRLQQYTSARRLLVQAREDAAHRGFYREEAIASENLATVHHMLRDYARALSDYRTAFTLLRYLGNPEYLARIANNLGEIYLRFGDVERARSTRGYARHKGAENPSSRVEAEGRLLDGRVHLAQGDCGRAATTFEQAAQLFESLGDRHHRAEALIWQSQACMEQDRTDEARALMDEAEPLVTDDERLEARLSLLRGVHARLVGEEAEGFLERSLRMLRESGDIEGELEGLTALAEVELDRGDTVFAREHLARASELRAAIRSRVPDSFHESFDASPARRRLDVLETRAAAMERSRSGDAGRHRTRKGGRTRSPYPKLVGRSEAMQVVFRSIERVAPLDEMVLVQGESGTGKELVAEAIHARSSRADRPLIKINCASFVDNLLQSELFGHERGAFTGAVRRRKGWFESASGGTLFLDEIGDISPATQVNLLRVLQDGVIYRVGGRDPVRVDVRLIAATNRDLERAVADGRFRKDLYYRLQGLRIVVPPLRQRPEDLAPLVSHLVETIASEFKLPDRRIRPSPGALRLLASLSWPGNVRELENTIRSTLLFSDEDVITQQQLEPHINVEDGNNGERNAVRQDERSGGGGQRTDVESAQSVDLDQVLLGAVSLPQFKKEIERRCIAEAIRQTRGNITRAAALLGMKRPRLSQLVKQYGIPKDGPYLEE